jgi:hypothetical protein
MSAMRRRQNPPESGSEAEVLPPDERARVVRLGPRFKGQGAPDVELIDEATRARRRGVGPPGAEPPASGPWAIFADRLSQLDDGVSPQGPPVAADPFAAHVRPPAPPPPPPPDPFARHVASAEPLAPEAARPAASPPDPGDDPFAGHISAPAAPLAPPPPAVRPPVARPAAPATDAPELAPWPRASGRDLAPVGVTAAASAPDPQRIPEPADAGARVAPMPAAAAGEGRSRRSTAAWLIPVALVVGLAGAALVLAVDRMGGDSGGAGADAGAPASIGGPSAGSGGTAPAGGSGQAAGGSAQAPDGVGGIAGTSEECRVRFTRAVLGPPPLDKLQRLGISLEAIRPTIALSQAQYAFFIRSSTQIGCRTLGGVVGLRGGVRFRLRDRSVDFRRFRIDATTGTATVFNSAQVFEGEESIRLDLANAKRVEGTDFVTLSVPVVLTALGADDVNIALGIGAFTADEAIGTFALTGEKRRVTDLEPAPES